MRLADFLIIGAMKSGTTSLAYDLAASPQIFLPSVKEPHFFCRDEVLSRRGRARYAALFRHARDNQFCGEASTGYSKLPNIKGVPHRAKQLLGPKARMIYLVRNPVERALSHHYHLLRVGRASADVNRAVREIPALVDYGRYAMQLRPWIKMFGLERIHVVVFEDYVRRRKSALDGIAEFLGVHNFSKQVDPGTVHNRGEEVLVARPAIRKILRAITRSQWYKLRVHPYLPRHVTQLAKRVVVRRAGVRQEPSSRDAIRFLVDRLADDAEELRTTLGRCEPLWDFAKMIEEDSPEVKAAAYASPECHSPRSK